MKNLMYLSGGARVTLSRRAQMKELKFTEGCCSLFNGEDVGSALDGLEPR